MPNKRTVRRSSPGEDASAGPEPRRTRVIAIANQKGGVGKSTTAVSLGAALAEIGRRVLVVDLDPQGNASTGLGIRHDARDVTVYDVLAAEAPLAEAVVATPVENLFAVPSTIDLAGAEIELVSQFSRELRLRRALEPMHDAGFDFIFLDCPPSLGLLTVNALAAAEELIVPIQCEYYALEGLGQLLRNVRLVQQNVNPGLQLTGIVMTMFDPRTKLSEQVVVEVRKFFGDRVYRAIIPRTVRLSEAPGFGQPITVYDPRSRGAECYRDLAREVVERLPTDEPMPAFDDIAISVTPPPEPRVMTAPHPLSRAEGDADLEAEPAMTEAGGGAARSEQETAEGPSLPAEPVQPPVGHAEPDHAEPEPDHAEPEQEPAHLEVVPEVPPRGTENPGNAAEPPPEPAPPSPAVAASPEGGELGEPPLEPEGGASTQAHSEPEFDRSGAEDQAEMKLTRTIVFDEPDGSFPSVDDLSGRAARPASVEDEEEGEGTEEDRTGASSKRRWSLFRRGGKR